MHKSFLKLFKSQVEHEDDAVTCLHSALPAISADSEKLTWFLKGLP